MRKNMIICDRCGNEINGEPNIILEKIQPRTGGKIGTIEFCEDCAKDYTRWIIDGNSWLAKAE